MNPVEAVFGPAFAQSSAEDAARTSSLKFVRGRHALGLYDATRNPTGHVLTAWEALHAYGLPILEEAVEYGSAILNHPIGMAPAIDRRCETLGLTPSDAHADDRTIDSLEYTAFILGLDELRAGYRPTDAADDALAVRLKTLQREGASYEPRLRPAAVRAFAHAASVIRTQHRLQGWLGIAGFSDQFEPTDDYGSTISPAYRVGYDLAARARTFLGLNDSPIESMRDLVEKMLGIPVIQTALPATIAGATLAVNSEHGEVRGIVLNTEGDNRNVWVRRATLAHELGHLLFDPVQQLDLVRVDTYQSSRVDPQAPARDRVEQRANAFAIAFLAPVELVRDMVSTPIEACSVREVQSTFGISYTAATHHIQNAHYGNYELPRDRLRASPSNEQVSAENFTTDYFPIPSTPDERVGRFVYAVTECFDEGYISEDSAAKYLNCSKATFVENLDHLRGLYASE